MKKPLGIAILGCAFAASLSLALAAPDRSVPDRIDPESWIPLGPDAGFIITGPEAQGPRTETGSAIRGFFVARRNGKWVRLNAESQPQTIPAR